MSTSFDVFLSHNSKDKPAVRELAEALRARGIKVWLDESELVPGQPWQEALEKIIQTVRSAAVLVGRDGLGPWEIPEMRGCLSEFVDRKLPVIPVLLPGAPDQPALPLFLKGFTWVDLRGGITEEGLGRLEWGITGKKPSRWSGKPSLLPIDSSGQERERAQSSRRLPAPIPRGRAPSAPSIRPGMSGSGAATPGMQKPTRSGKESPSTRSKERGWKARRFGGL